MRGLELNAVPRPTGPGVLEGAPVLCCAPVQHHWLSHLSSSPNELEKDHPFGECALPCSKSKLLLLRMQGWGDSSPHLTRQGAVIGA